MGEIRSLDLVVGAIVAVALLRGLYLGLIREAFSIGALAAAIVGVRVFHEPLAKRLLDVSGGEIGAAAPWIAGAGIAIVSVAAVAWVGRLLHRGARVAGLGWADRAGGALLGTAEGLLAAGVLLLVFTTLFGRDHTLVAGSRSIDALEELERQAQGRGRLDVAAPPRGN